MNRRITAAACILLLLAALTPASEPQTPPAETESPADKAPDAAGADAVVAAGNAFAIDTYARLRGEAEGNLFFSPTSIHTALAMTYAGARGTTAEQMETALHLPEDADDIHAGFAKLIADLNDPATIHIARREEDGKVMWQKVPAYQLHVANALWPQAGYPFKEAFTGLVRTQYAAALEQLDYKAPAKARTRINAWVEDKTNEKIKNLIPAGVLDPLTRLVLTNAVYFKSNWSEDFSKHATKDGDFHVSPEKTVTAPLMHQTESFGYAETDALQVLSLPYKANELDMVVLLPREVDGLAALEDALTAEKLAGWLEALQRQRVRVTLPKWEFTSKFRLKSVLSAMGMPDAFDPEKADFSGMTDAEKLFISAVLHKAFVAVDEEGTEAAAATAVVMDTRAMPPATEPKVFTADHPFVFCIRHRPTGAILFMGRVANPAK
ncbi:MAG: serpin family protein [Phycisphaerae bacterium]|nr:serpin family protein [Phycisphaerae bacterium]